MKINMQDHKLDEKKITVALTVPGWPARYYPNGIVTYVNNIILGFSSSITAIILAAPLAGDVVDSRVIDLSKIKARKNIMLKIFDALLLKFNLKPTHAIQYTKTMVFGATRIATAIKYYPTAINIIEMEESFGLPHFLLKNTKIPIVTRLHGPWFTIGEIMHANKNWDFRLRVFYEGEAIKNSHGVTAPSLDVLEKVRKYYDIALPYAQVIPNPVPEVEFSKLWKLNNNKRQYILFVGRFDSPKGGDLMLDAFRLIAKKNSKIALLFVGPDRKVILESRNANFSEYVELFIPEDKIKSRIEFLGHCDHDRIADLRRNALVTVACSRYETFSIALVESLAAGCPTVATAVGGMKEIIIDDYNGLLAEPESPESIAEKVLSLIDDPEKMQRLSKNAIEDCKKRFSPEVVAAQTVEYYQSVLARVSDLTAKN